jgi:hypothetical protein
MRQPIRLDRDQLEQLAQVKFSDRDLEELEELLTDYRDRGLALYEPMPEFILRYAQLSRPLAAVEREARQAFVEAVAAIWHECDAKQNAGKRNNKRKRNRRGYFYSRERGHTGPLLELVLLTAIGEKEPGGKIAPCHGQS